MRLKKDIKPIESALPLLMKLQAKTYHYKDNEANAHLSYGFIAQDVETIFPDVVTTKGTDSLKAIAYQKLNVAKISFERILGENVDSWFLEKLRKFVTRLKSNCTC